VVRDVPAGTVLRIVAENCVPQELELDTWPLKLAYLRAERD